MLGWRKKPLFERLKAQNTSTKTPVLASPTQAETASGVCPTNLGISAGSSRMKSTKWSYFPQSKRNFVFCSQKYVWCSFSSSTVHFNFKITPHLKLQVEVEDWLESKFWYLKPHLKKPRMISHHFVVLIWHDSDELWWFVQGGLDPSKISGVGTNFGLLVHVLPGPNKGFLC
jgi:hypothetical protein